jgi:hypothetical protein
MNILEAVMFPEVMVERLQGAEELAMTPSWVQTQQCPGELLLGKRPISLAGQQFVRLGSAVCCPRGILGNKKSLFIKINFDFLFCKLGTATGQNCCVTGVAELARCAD